MKQFLCLFTLAAAAAGQTGRVMHQTAPPVLGTTATFAMSYPATAAGNLYLFLWSSPPFPGSTNISVPGLIVNGVARVDPIGNASVFSGLLGPSGNVSHSIVIPNTPSFVGFAWDLQSVDLDLVAFSLSFADNDIEVAVSGSVPSSMVPITSGSFAMGTTQLQAGCQPVHTVTITRPFWVGRTEVRQSEYQALMGSNPSTFPGPNRPVETVTWSQAMAYCAALTSSAATAGRLPSGYQYRLPTEAEWEYCCRAGTITEWSTGGSLVCGQANFYDLVTAHFCVGQTSVVGSYPANPWGLSDMHGNVTEWCLDSWDGSPNYPATAVADPWVQVGQYRTLRGGNWDFPADVCRSAMRSTMLPNQSNFFTGFRVVLAPIL